MHRSNPTRSGQSRHCHLSPMMGYLDSILAYRMLGRYMCSAIFQSLHVWRTMRDASRVCVLIHAPLLTDTTGIPSAQFKGLGMRGGILSTEVAGNPAITYSCFSRHFIQSHTLTSSQDSYMAFEIPSHLQVLAALQLRWWPLTHSVCLQQRAWPAWLLGSCHPQLALHRKRSKS